MSQFETNPKSLKFLLTQIHHGELALPDFQRDFVWDPGAIEELIESIMRHYPAGSLLFLKHTGDGFKVREFDGAPLLKSEMGTSYLVLDGQQRLTSLYQAFFGKGEHRFFLDIKTLISSGDVEAAVWHESERRCQRQRYLEIEVQARELYCPLEVVMGDGFDSWIDSIMELRPEPEEDAKSLRASLRRVHREWILPILDYQFPVISLGADTPLEAVCKMFETLNRRGVKLTVFELLMARSFASKVSLRHLWDEAISANPILSDFEIDPYYVLQIASLLNDQTIKRGDVLDMSPSIVSKYWHTAISSLTESIEFLRRKAGVLTPALLPYNTMLVPLAAAWARTADLTGPRDSVRRERFEQWFWASVFSQAYERGPTSRAVSDFKELQHWIRNDGEEPFSIRCLHFSPEMFFEVTPKQRALYRGTLALVTAQGALDFHNAECLTFDYVEKNKVDDHHIFPHNFLKKNGGAAKAHSVLNRTLIDRKTNIRISDKAPSIYINDIASQIGEERLARILGSHLLDVESLKSNDFDKFLKDRAHALIKELSLKMRREIPRTPVAYFADDEEIDDGSEERFTARDRHDPALINIRPEDLLKDLPAGIGEMFDAFSSALLENLPEIWWRSSIRKVSFYSPLKTFVTVRLSRTGLHLVTFSDGQPLDGAEPIIHRNRGGELWARLKMRTLDDLDRTIRVTIESHRRLLSAEQQGRPTAWWALRKKD